MCHFLGNSWGKWELSIVPNDSGFSPFAVTPEETISHPTQKCNPSLKTKRAVKNISLTYLARHTTSKCFRGQECKQVQVCLGCAWLLSRTGIPTVTFYLGCQFTHSLKLGVWEVFWSQMNWIPLNVWMWANKYSEALKYISPATPNGLLNPPVCFLPSLSSMLPTLIIWQTRKRRGLIRSLLLRSWPDWRREF